RGEGVAEFLRFDADGGEHGRLSRIWRLVAARVVDGCRVRDFGWWLDRFGGCPGPRYYQCPTFATLERERPDALFVAGDAFFASRAVQFATLTARGRIPATYSLREFVAVGRLMSYGTDATEAFRQAGVYTGKILKGAKPVDLPVVQSTKFEFIINM